ncbi:MAG TPA: homoserine kinase, partial [Acidimicrobiia bacterium]|nr:homoserine kinase [Acidimicrobiia bacterium]
DSWSIDHGEGQQPDADADDAVLAAAQRAVGERRPLAIKVDNEIPIGRGLGSSAAALAAGAAAALAATGVTVDRDHVFELISRFEGHPDNAAAAVYGGLVLVPPQGRPLRLPIHPRLRPVVAVPQDVYLTSEARRALPPSVDLATAVRTSARACALVAGFLTGDAEMFAAAHGDELHEQPRAKIRPDTAELVRRARDAGALHAAWSGSGPSVVALVDQNSESHVVEALSAPGTKVLVVGVATSGLEVSA